MHLVRPKPQVAQRQAQMHGTVAYLVVTNYFIYIDEIYQSNYVKLKKCHKIKWNAAYGIINQLQMFAVQARKR